MKNRPVRPFLDLAALLILMMAPILNYAQKVDSQKSVVEFSISNWKVNTVNGKISGMHGKLNIKGNALENAVIDVCIKPNTIKTGIEKRDDHLKTEDFFFVDRYPEICFTSTKITPKGEKYIASGTMELHGVKRKETIVLWLENKDGQRLLRGTLKINRFDYGLGAEAYSNTLMIGSEAEVEIYCFLED